MWRTGEGRERRSGGVLLCWVTAHVVRHSATRRVAVAAARVRSLIYDSARPSIIATWASRPPLPSAIRSAAATGGGGARMRPSSCMKPINYGAINDATVAAGSISIIDQRAAGHRTRLRNDVVCPVTVSPLLHLATYCRAAYSNPC